MTTHLDTGDDMSSELRKYLKTLEDKGVTVHFDGDMTEENRQLIRKQAEESFEKYKATLRNVLEFGIDSVPDETSKTHFASIIKNTIGDDRMSTEEQPEEKNQEEVQNRQEFTNEQDAADYGDDYDK